MMGGVHHPLTFALEFIVDVPLPKNFSTTMYNRGDNGQKKIL